MCVGCDEENDGERDYEPEHDNHFDDNGKRHEDCYFREEEYTDSQVAQINKEENIESKARKIQSFLKRHTKRKKEQREKDLENLKTVLLRGLRGKPKEKDRTAAEAAAIILTRGIIYSQQPSVKIAKFLANPKDLTKSKYKGYGYKKKSNKKSTRKSNSKSNSKSNKKPTRKSNSKSNSKSNKKSTRKSIRKSTRKSIRKSIRKSNNKSTRKSTKNRKSTN